MIRLLAAGAAVFALAALGSKGALAWCDEDCAYAAQEAAYERAEALEAAEEDRYEAPDARAERSRPNAQRQPARASAAGRKPSERRAIAAAARPRRSDPDLPAPSIPPPVEAASENSSIATAALPATDDDGIYYPAATRTVGCKTYFPTVGMTLTVHCD